MPIRLLNKIHSPADIKDLSYDELDQLAFELRAKMIGTCSLQGGHLASSLGAVELIIALHRVLDCPHDRIIFDVGHQSYAHKLLTGRFNQFDSLRMLNGISGFPKITESPYDAHDAGHASDSISTALGYALARDMDGGDETIVAFIGDASLSGGMSFEALNQIASMHTKLIIVLNDNGMSISKNVGGIATSLAQARLSKTYTSVRDCVEDAVSSKGKVGKFLMDTGNAFKESFKQLVLPSGMLFEQLGITYIGPVDGHNISMLEELFTEMKDFDGPILVHAVTTKGKGYYPSELHPDVFHGIGPFNIETGKVKKTDSAKTWTSAFSDALINIAHENENVVAITAAMATGTGLDAFAQEFPDRFIDVGIAEEHAVTMASSLAMAGKVPVVAIYSTFLQRAYDQIMINVALQNQHVVFCLDRAGLVGEDGPTHHGSFDLSYLRTIPNMTILAPSDEKELVYALEYAIAAQGPIAIRYPRGSVIPSLNNSNQDEEAWSLKARLLYHSNADDHVALLGIGSMVQTALEVAKVLKTKGIFASVYDMRSVKPLDIALLQQLRDKQLVVTLEENSICGGFGSAVLEAFNESNFCMPRVLRLALPDSFIEQGSISELHHMHGLDVEGVTNSILKALDI